MEPFFFPEMMSSYEWPPFMGSFLKREALLFLCLQKYDHDAFDNERLPLQELRKS